MSRLGLWRQLRLSFRGLAKRPRFALTVVLLLALGIGGTTAIFTLLDALFLHPLPVSHLEQLVALYRTTKQEGGGFGGFDNFSYLDYRDIAERNRSFSGMALYQWMPMSLSGGDEPERIRGVFATSTYFTVLGIRPALGRFFLPQDDTPGGVQAEAVLSYGAWQRLFGSRRDAVGRTIRVNGHPFTVVGVGPRGFKGTDLDAGIDVWGPLQMWKVLTNRAALFDERDVATFHPLARLRPGVPSAAARSEMLDLAHQLTKEHPNEDKDKEINVLPLLAGAVVPREHGRYEGYGKTLALAAALILVIACVNVASLLGLRRLERRRELAIRQALGGGQSAVVATLFVENFVLFLLGGLASLAVARLGLSLLWSLRPPEFAPGAPQLEISLPLLGFALLVTFAVFLVVGVVQAFLGDRRNLVTALKDGGDAPGRRRLVQPRSLWVILEVALALVALIGANILLVSLRGSTSVDLGFDAGHVLAVTVAPGEQGYGAPQTLSYYRRAEERMRALPGVVAAAFSEHRLLRGSIFLRPIYVAGRADSVRSGDRPQQRVNAVTPGFFKTAGIPIVRGRDFTDSDCATCRPVAIINETLAKLAWPGQDAVGKIFHFDDMGTPGIEVVGVAHNAKVRYIHEPPTIFVYLPLAQSYAPSMTLHVRTAGDPAAMLPAVRRELRALDPNLPIAEADTMEHFVAGALWIDRTAALLLTLFGVLALALAVVGVYGMTLFLVFQQRRETGLRFALGATRGRVVRRILGGALAVASVGVALGWLLAWLALAPVLTSQLFGVTPRDPWSYLSQAALLLAAAALASALPAVWAARAAPADLLRGE
ncbi:MAG TPA: ABC transporter permease [Thermoanaerobaculia bacterium]